MKRAMDNNNTGSITASSATLSTVLDRCVNMLSELSTSNLTPKNYYELHMKVLDQMQFLEDYLQSHVYECEGLINMQTLYETVQYCTKVVPRLYLQICAGSALIKSKLASSQHVLEELIEAVKCVQNPVRGLFLRHYLLQATRDKLPDSGNEEYGEDVSVSYSFILRNFVEMNRLWVRIAHMHVSSKEQKKKRERERNELRILVGTNLVRLSQLDGITVDIFKTVILPKILDQVTTCKDTLAQAYLMDCIIQVFPEHFHCGTLEEFLLVCPKLKEKVHVRNILQEMMDRLANFEETNAFHNEENGLTKKMAVPEGSFQLFHDCICKIHAVRGNKISLKEVVCLQTTLLNFSLKCYPGNFTQVNHCLGVCADALNTNIAAQAQTNDFAKLDDAAVEELERLLSIPLQTLALQVLELERYSDLLAFLPWENRKQVAKGMLKAVITTTSKLDDVERVEKLFAIISPLLRDEPGNAKPTSSSSSSVNHPYQEHAGFVEGAANNDGGTSAISFQEEQGLVARLVHLFQNDDTDVLFKMYSLARKHFAHGGQKRIHYTMVPLVFVALPLVYRVHSLEYPAPVIVKKEEIVAKDEDKVEEEATVEDTNQSSTTQDEAAEENKQSSATPDEKENDDKTAEESKESEKSEQSPDKSAEETAQDEEVKDDQVVEETKQSSTTEDTSIEEKQEEPKEAVIEETINGIDALTMSPEMNEPTKPQSFNKVVNCRKLFLFLQKIIATLAPTYPELSFKLYLDVAITANNCSALSSKHKPISSPSKLLSESASLFGSGSGCDFSAMSYEFMSQAFLIYEDEMSDSKAQFRSIVGMVGTLLKMNTFAKEDYEALITKTAQYGAKLLKKPDQCKMVTLCSHLFYNTGGTSDNNNNNTQSPTSYQNPKRVLECLQRSLKIADICMSQSPVNISLFIEILDHYVYYFEKEVPLITDKFVSGLIALINEHIDNIKDYSDASIQAQAHYRQILNYITVKKKKEGAKDHFGKVYC